MSVIIDHVMGSDGLIHHCERHTRSAQGNYCWRFACRQDAWHKKHGTKPNYRFRTQEPVNCMWCIADRWHDLPGDFWL